MGTNKNLSDLLNELSKQAHQPRLMNLSPEEKKYMELEARVLNVEKMLELLVSSIAELKGVQRTQQ